jgi:uncharacterized protein YjbI with pentapeptide repeats
LIKANLTLCQLTGASFTDANLYGANLLGTDLNEVILERCNLLHAILPDGTRWQSDQD